MLILIYADETKHEAYFYSSILYSLWSKVLEDPNSIYAVARDDLSGEFMGLHIIPAFFLEKHKWERSKIPSAPPAQKQVRIFCDREKPISLSQE